MLNASWYPFFTQLVFYVWPLVAFYLLMKKSRRGLERIALTLFLTASLVLPMLVRFDLPSVPPMGKEATTCLVIMLYIVWKQRRRLRNAKPLRGIDLFIVASMIASFGTIQTNPDPLAYGSWITTHLPGLKFKDSLSLAIRDLFDFGLPFILGRVLLRTADDLEDMLRLLVIAGLWYSLACLVEIRMSPQIHDWVWGFPQHRAFEQTMRWGGWRPMVCMAHGLAVAMFMTAATMSAGALSRLKRKVATFKLKVASRVAMIYLAIILLACKSTGAIVYALVFVPTIAKAKVKNVMRTALVLATFVGVYPTLRTLDWFPTVKLVELVQSSLGPERAQSMEFRFENEDLLLNKAMERPYFGWGGYGRGRVYDDEMGKEITIADGQWIIIVSSRGFVGMACFFALLLGPIFALRKRLKRIRDRREQTLAACTALLLAVYCLDMVPNASFSIIPFIIAGGLWTVSNNMVKGVASPQATPYPQVPRMEAPAPPAPRRI